MGTILQVVMVLVFASSRLQCASTLACSRFRLLIGAACIASAYWISNVASCQLQTGPRTGTSRSRLQRRGKASGFDLLMYHLRIFR